MSRLVDAALAEARRERPALSRLLRGLGTVIVVFGGLGLLIASTMLWFEALDRWEGWTFGLSTVFWVLVLAWCVGKE